jgi:hypothetical protein
VIGKAKNKRRKFARKKKCAARTIETLRKTFGESSKPTADFSLLSSASRRVRSGDRKSKIESKNSKTKAKRNQIRKEKPESTEKSAKKIKKIWRSHAAKCGFGMGRDETFFRLKTYPSEGPQKFKPPLPWRKLS